MLIRLFDLVGGKESDFILLLMYFTADDLQLVSHTDIQTSDDDDGFMLHHIPLQMDLKTEVTVIKRECTVDHHGIISNTRAPWEVSTLVVTHRPLEHQVGKCR